MVKLRTSEQRDVPALKELWKLAFGDEDGYIDHFFTQYYLPKRMLVLEEDGVVRAMTAWFDMPLVCSDGTTVPSAYLYAVATHPDCRGRALPASVPCPPVPTCICFLPRTALRSALCWYGGSMCLSREQRQHRSSRWMGKNTEG